MPHLFTPWAREFVARAEGRSLGPPRPGCSTAPCSINASNRLCSCRCPDVKTSAIGLPPPSARRSILVLNPPRLRPNAWSWYPFLPRLRESSLSFFSDLAMKEHSGVTRGQQGAEA